MSESNLFEGKREAAAARRADLRREPARKLLHVKQTDLSDAAPDGHRCWRRSLSRAGIRSGEAGRACRAGTLRPGDRDGSGPDGSRHLADRA